jgi:hypothetical protein
MGYLDLLKVKLRAGDPQSENFGTRLLRGDVFGGVDAPGRAFQKAAGASLGDAHPAREEEKPPRPAMLCCPFLDSGLGGLRHARG